ncbi:MAG: 23S rRNA (uracil(1939)-C(5))-methyltransferase RlmD [Eubacteriales bacterium]|nr:23S rRNA (uracil(1939)-C(5))-methyltransferase RlmD [Eubacteriales bacterium]
MEYRKNDIVTLEIEDCGIDGEGIGKADGFTVFVKDAVIGDTVRAKIMKAKKNYGYGRLMEILNPSPYRTEPRCAYARQCGGCQLQALVYEKQLEFKETKVRNHLERIGGFTEIPMEPIIGMEEPFHYRNKAQFPVGRNKDGKIITGFYAGRTHTIIENRDCALGVPRNKEVLDRVISYMEASGAEPYEETSGRGLVRHILIRYGFFTGEIMVCLIVNGKRLPKEELLVKSLRELPGMTSITLNVNQKRNNVILGDELRLLWGQTYITDRIGEVSYQISPLSFYQVNPQQTQKLYAKALEYAGLTGNETVWDLYCGIGTISLFLAKNAKYVRGVEIVPQAIEDARRNARINGIENVEFFVGKAEEVLPREYEKNGVYADVIVVDPPRKGCDEVLLQTIIKMQPKRVVYVSCDSATLARDLRYLCDNGYKLEKICPLDQFGQTVHVESIVKLVRKSNRKSKPDTHVDLTLDMEDYYRIKDQEKQSNK